MFERDLQELEEKFNSDIKGKWIEFERISDGSIGNKLETELGKTINNSTSADWNSIELKSKNEKSSSLITLFSCAPTNSNILRKTYGKEVRVENSKPYKRLNATIGTKNKTNSKTYPYDFKINVNKNKEKCISIIVYDKKGNIVNDNDFYWNRESLRNGINKIKNIALFSARTKIENQKQYVQFNNFKTKHFNETKFFELIDNGTIKIDIRMGMYQTGKNTGKLHDHGTGFRITQKYFDY